MPESKNLMKEVLPKQGLLYQEDMPTVVLCKPKILPLKSVTLEKLEKMQKEAQDTVRQQEKETSLNDDMFAGIWTNWEQWYIMFVFIFVHIIFYC